MMIAKIYKMRKFYQNTKRCSIFFIFLIFVLVVYFSYKQKEIFVISLDKIEKDTKMIDSFDVYDIKHLTLPDTSCDFFSCFNVYKCGNKGNRLSVYVYSPKDYAKSFPSIQSKHLQKDYNLILQAVTSSKYYTDNPNEACIFVTSFDIFNFERRNFHLLDSFNLFQFVRNGVNHLIFRFIHEDSGESDFINQIVPHAMIAGIGFTKDDFRSKFDISLPIFRKSFNRLHPRINSRRKWLFVSAQLNIDLDIKKKVLEMRNLFPDEMQILHSCSQMNMTNDIRCTNHNSYNYPEILQASIFCSVLRGEKFGLSVILDALVSQCIPVIIFDTLVMPFNEVIDWTRAAVFIREADVLLTINILKKYSNKKIKELQNHGLWMYQKYFQTLEKITDTTLDIVADRIFPYFAKNYDFWNKPQIWDIESPITIPSNIPKNDGFTAVILTYDRIDLLFFLINKLSKVPSLIKILIIWNNDYKKPPRLLKWPKIQKVIKIIETEKNALSNRFYPFEEIETEAILSIDDDIIMLSDDEIEFAFEVWREFPDRIVGFPSRTHAWDNKTISWRYESEWTNRVSMVLTGAAFYHKYWNYAYTVYLPIEIKDWVDGHMNCEDIAMNFLVSNITKKSPIKVTPKKKFRCPECVNTEMLSADLTHMVERTQCINQFTKIFGHMPLMSVEFRADPVLFRDNFPDKLKRFTNVGNL